MICAVLYLCIELDRLARYFETSVSRSPFIHVHALCIGAERLLLWLDLHVRLTWLYLSLITLAACIAVSVQSQRHLLPIMVATRLSSYVRPERLVYVGGLK